MKISRTALLCAILVASAASAQQGICERGETRWVQGCRAECTAGWEGSNCPQSCTAAPPPGYVILDTRLVDVSDNNGSHSLSRIAANQSWDYKRHVEQAYNYAIDLAVRAGKKDAEAHLKSEMNNAIKEAESFSSSHQMVRLYVDASKHGSFIDRKRGWSKRTVEMQIRCVAPSNLMSQLAAKHQLPTRGR